MVLAGEGDSLCRGLLAFVGSFLSPSRLTPLVVIVVAVVVAAAAAASVPPRKSAVEEYTAHGAVVAPSSVAAGPVGPGIGTDMSAAVVDTDIDTDTGTAPEPPAPAERDAFPKSPHHHPPPPEHPPSPAPRHYSPPHTT